jgi:serine/threonine-protein kinase RsbW
MGDKLRFEVPGKLEYMQTVRLTVGSIASLCGFDVEAVNDVQLAVEDAIKFVVCHGGEGFSETFDVEAEIGEKELKISVSDYSSPGKVSRENRHFCMRCPEEGDMGIFVIDSLMDSYKLEVREDGCKKLIMVKNR